MNLKRLPTETMEEFLARVHGQQPLTVTEADACANCRFHESSSLQCRRYAPSLAVPPMLPPMLPRRVRRPRRPLPPLQFGAFPLTRRDDWCGEYQPRPPLQG
jgi:hypothetical protein